MRNTDQPYLWDDEIKNLRLGKRERRALKETNTIDESNKKGDTGVSDVLIREKRKSGKTTGALSRQSKTDSGSSKSATSNRKVQSKAIIFKMLLIIDKQYSCFKVAILMRNLVFHPYLIKNHHHQNRAKKMTIARKKLISER